MAMKGRSGFLAKLKRDAVEAFADTVGKEGEVSDFADLPGGITGGVARLVECKLDQVKEGKDDAGEYYFTAAAVVVSPEKYEGQVVKGGRTSIIEPLYDTPKRQSRKTQAEHLIWVSNFLKTLGAPPDMDLDDLEATCEAIKESKPYVKFSTREGQRTPQYPDTKVFHTWHGTVNPEDVEDGDDSGGVEDETVPAKPAVAIAPAGKKPTAGKPKPAPAKGAEPEPEDAPEEFDEFSDLDGLAAKADKKDKAAIKELEKLADAAGIGTDEFDEAPDYAAVAELIKAKGRDWDDQASEGKDEEEEDDEEEDDDGVKTNYVPAPGNIVNYAPPGANGKPGRKVFECEVLKVSAKSRTADLKNLDDPSQKYTGVDWADLVTD